MLSYSKRILLFSIPLLLVASPFIFQYGLFKISGENTYAFSDTSKLLVGYKYDNYRDIYYKRNIVTSEKFDIIGIGSSRILQFRQAFFDRSFYAWNIINYSQDYLSVLETLKKSNHLPSYILLQLDERTFNKNFDKDIATLANLKYPNTISLSPSLTRDVIRDYFTLSRKSTFANYKLEGLAAQYYFSGYRKDGSYQYGKLVYDMNYRRTAFDSSFRATMDKIKPGDAFFDIDFRQRSLENLNSFLDSCTKENIHVICFFQSYPALVIEKLQKKSLYPAIVQTHRRIDSLLKKYNNQHLYINSELLSTDNDLNIDGIHPNEWSNVKLLLSIPAGSVFRRILSERLLVEARPASTVCIDSAELLSIRNFFESTKN